MHAESAVVLLVLIIGVVNVCLGYGLAVWAGYAPPNLDAAWYAATCRLVRLRAEPSSAAPAAVNPPPHAAEMPLEQMLDSGVDDEPDVQPFDEPYDDDLSELLAPEAPEVWDVGEKFVETSILRLNVAMMRSGARATEIDSRLRACAGRTDEETIRECLALLQEDCATYLAEQSEAAERFHARIEELGELKSLGEEIAMANLEQSAQVETSINNLKFMDFFSDLEAANRHLLEEIHNLRTARHRLRDNQEAAFLQVARYENRLEKIEKQLYNDPLTRLRNRIGLETTLHDWWQEGRHKSRPMSVLLLDADHFGKVNQEHGSLLGDRVLFQLAQFIHGALGTGDLVGRFAGESFLAAIVDAGPRAACKNAETLRQAVEKIGFVSGEKTIRVTVRGGLTEVNPDDDEHAVLQRLQEAIREAKGHGPNCIFLHDGKTATLLESPNFGAKETEIRI